MTISIIDTKDGVTKGTYANLAALQAAIADLNAHPHHIKHQQVGTIEGNRVIARLAGQVQDTFDIVPSAAREAVAEGCIWDAHSQRLRDIAA